MKLLLVLLLVAVAAVASVPFWGSCDLRHQVCTTWCEARHYGTDVKITACKARCAAEKAGCVAGQGAEGLGELLEDDAAH